MEQARDLLLAVWREACRHIEIDESARSIAAILQPRLPIHRLTVRRCDTDGDYVETVADVWSGQPPSPEPDRRTPVPPSQRRRLARWVARGELQVIDVASRTAAFWKLVLPPAVEGTVLAGPLVSEHDTTGVLMLEAPAGKNFTEAHRRFAELLLEPFSTAIENDARLRELNAYREAAEADRRSLLRRLGRKEIEDPIVGADAGLRPVIERVELVSRSDAPVLILGETGSGKEVVARAIHARSGRAPRPFIRVNCGAIPPDLIDSELFGHEVGAFTGAVSQRRGWFERADGGTLFLDEIGELPLAAQVRLLRVLQDGVVERVGGEHPQHVDVRIVAATHRDLPAMVQRGAFREDLWYRIAVFPIVLPPLREHREDIPALAEHFARRAAVRFGLPYVAPTLADIELIMRYDWPGNVRELASVIDRAAILGNGERLEVAKALGLPSAGRERAVNAANQNGNALISGDQPHGLATLDDAIRRHIEVALQKTHGRVEGPHGAARLLNVNPNTLRSKMRRLGIRRSEFRSMDGAM